MKEKVKQLIELIKNSGKTIDQLAEEAEMEVVDMKHEFETTHFCIETLEKLSKIVGFQLYSFWNNDKIENITGKIRIYKKAL